MALEGSIKDFGLADIFQLIHLQKKTGILTVKNAGIQAKVTFENGCVVAADVMNNIGLDKIGEILLRTKQISNEQLKEALLTQRKRKDKIGVILVGMGAIKKEDVVKALGLRVKEAVYGLFKLKEGSYTFEPADISYERDYWLPINTEFLIMEGVRRIDEWPFIQKKIPSFDLTFKKNESQKDKLKGVKAEGESFEELFGESGPEEGITITPEEMTIYNLIDGRQTVQHLIELGRMGDFETCKALSSLLTAGLIEPQDQPKPVEMKSVEGFEVHINRPPILTRTRIGSGLIIIVCLILLGIGAGKIKNGLHETLGLYTFYKNISAQNRLQQMRFYIETFYYRNDRLPEPNDPVFNKIPGGRKTIQGLGNGEMHYELQNEASLYRLSILESTAAR